MFVDEQEGGGAQVEVGQQLACVPGVLAGDHVCLGQFFDGSAGDVSEVADGGSHQNQRPWLGGRPSLPLLLPLSPSMLSLLFPLAGRLPLGPLLPLSLPGV